MLDEEMGIKRVRNLANIPFIEKEGAFIKPLPTPPNINDDRIWFDGMDPNTRLFYHQTLNSVRRFAGFRQYP